MGRRKNDESVADRQPTEIGELKALVSEFMERYGNVENELELLKTDLKELVEEYSDRLDTKTLQQAIRVVKAQRKVKHKDTFDTFVTILDEMGTV